MNTVISGFRKCIQALRSPVPALILAFSLLFASCDTVLQYPEEPADDDTRLEATILLHVHCDSKFKYLDEIEYDFLNPTDVRHRSASSESRVPASHNIRLILRAFSADDKSISPVPVKSWSFFLEDNDEFDESFEIELLPGDYRLVMWGDYVDAESRKDFYYSTIDFAEITLKNDEGHYGSNDHRMAFYGETSISVMPKHSDTIEAEFNLVSPFAKYSFVSTDIDEFLENEIGRLRSADSPPKAPNMSDYTVRVVYTQYMPCAFNVHSGKPVDSRTGVEYRSLLSLLDKENGLLAFDYIFTNGTSTSIAVAMEILHRDGSVVARIPQFDIPLRRHQHTIVYGKFLTTKSGGNIGVSPDFSGEFNIEIR